MRGFIRSGALWFAVAVAGCDATPQEQAAAVCATVCNCESPLPSQQDECVAECTEDLQFIQLPQACVDCISAHANRCSTIEFDCAFVCDIDDEPPPPPEPGGFPDAPVD